MGAVSTALDAWPRRPRTRLRVAACCVRPLFPFSFLGVCRGKKKKKKPYDAQLAPFVSWSPTKCTEARIKYRTVDDSAIQCDVLRPTPCASTPNVPRAAAHMGPARVVLAGGHQAAGDETASGLLP